MDRLVQVLMYLVVAVVLWAGAKFAEPAVNRWQVQRLVDQVAINAIHPKFYGHVQENVTTQLASRGLPFAPEDIQVETNDSASMAKVAVSYWREIDLLDPPFFGTPVIEYSEDGELIWRDSSRGEREGAQGRYGLMMRHYDLVGVYDRSIAR